MGQWFKARSSRRLFYWINKPRVKPFLDAYHAPYKDKHRYWTGLLLYLRCALLLVFAFNTQADPSLNLLAISSVAFGLMLMTRYTGAVYRKLYVDILEASFIFNLGVFAVATYYVKLAVVPVSQAVVAYTSVSVLFATFIGVVLLNAYQQVQPKLQLIIQRLHRRDERENDNNSTDDEVDVEHEAQPLVAPTVSVIEHPSPQPLLFNELREPLNLINTNDL